MTPDILAALHARAMVIPGPWSAKDFSDLLASPGIFLVPAPSPVRKYPGGSARGAEPPSPLATTQSAQDLTGFALGRVVLDEAELLTLAVDPSARRQGIGTACLAAFEARARALGAASAFLEVAATNTAVRKLYARQGWQQTGIRQDYYRSDDGRLDAILMRKALVTA